MSVLLVRDDREYLCRAGEELQTDLGVVTAPADATAVDTVESHLGEPFSVRRPRLPDLFHHLDRTGAPMMPRDIGLIIGHLGIESGDRVLDAGTGTGILAVGLGRIDASVITYERNDEFAAVARENMELAGVPNRVEVRTADVTEDLDDLSGFDIVTLDMADAPTVVASAPDLLQTDGGMAVYSPFVEAARAVVETARDTGLSEIETYDTIQRAMDFDTRGSRPSTAGVGHTGYLSFCRRF